MPQEVARAAVPPALLRSTVLAATGGPTSAGAALLTHAILRGDADDQDQVRRDGRSGAPCPRLRRRHRRRQAARGLQARHEAKGQRPQAVIREQRNGREAARDGGNQRAGRRPRRQAGRRGQRGGAYFNADTDPVPMATSGPDGRFSIRLPKPDDDAALEGYLAMYPWLVASAPGYGVGWCERVLRPDRPAEQVVTLVEEGPPIEGRIVDLEGRPVVGANVQAAGSGTTRTETSPAGSPRLATAPPATSGKVLQACRSTRSPRSRSANIAIELSRSPPRPGTDGRFKLTGIGRDRIADLIVSGPGIATTEVYAFSRPEPEIRTVDRGMMRRQPFIVHAPQFQLALAPAGGSKA